MYLRALYTYSDAPENLVFVLLSTGKQGNNALGSVRMSIHLSVCVHSLHSDKIFLKNRNLEECKNSPW